MYILLDVDGVLNTSSDWKRQGVLNDNCVRAFCRWAEKYDARIILTSSWRLGFVASGSSLNSPQIQSLERKLTKYGLRITGVLRYDGSRGRAVAEFQKKYAGSVVLDDDESEMGDYKKMIDNLYIFDAKNGFTDRDGKKIDKMLAANKSHH